MKLLSQRISINKNPKITTIVILPYKSFWATLLMGAWLSMWLVIGITIFCSLFIFSLTDQEQLILWIFLSFWLYYFIKIGKSFFWILYGKELIKLDEFSLNYKKSLFNYGKTNVIFFENIIRINSNIPKEKSFESIWESSTWNIGMERICIETKLLKINVGRKLTENETSSLVNLIIKTIKKTSNINIPIVNSFFAFLTFFS